MTFSITITPGWISPDRRKALRDGAPPVNSYEREYVDGIATARLRRLSGNDRRG